MSPHNTQGQRESTLDEVTRRNAMKIGAVVAGGLGLSGVAPGTVTASVDSERESPTNTQLFLRLDEIKGELSDRNNEGAIEVIGWSWGASNPGSMHEPRGGGAGRSRFQDITVTKRADLATPILWRHLATGRTIASGSLHVHGGNENPIEYLVIELEQILIRDISTGGSTDTDRPIEEVSLNFAQFTITYTPQEPDGTPGPEVEMGYDIARNEEV